ncbi:hypothetical protein K438DRAFT_988156 [Mycena galopus ATCC 62051]|nr:hypothetical protein K438DRAFT_988156 [Mycena galopus ATCC 62051]
MSSPIIDKIFQFLETDLQPLIHGEKHVGHSGTREPIEYDYHMPPWLQPKSLEYDPELSSTLKEQLTETLVERTSIKQTDVDSLISRASFRMRDIVPRPNRVIGEPSVSAVQTRIHNIAGVFATLSCFNMGIDSLEIDGSVFTTSESPESNTEADLLVGCAPTLTDTPTDWASLWPSIIHPRDLRDPFFEVLYTEEYKNIRSGSPRAILGIYIIIWCLQKKHLETMWPDNRCENSKCKFAKSHKATRKFELAPKKVPEDRPLDAQSATKALVDTDMDALEAEIRRIIDLAEIYDKKYSIPPETRSVTAKNYQEEDNETEDGETEDGENEERESRDNESRDTETDSEEADSEEADSGTTDSDSDAPIPAQFLSYKERLEDALALASKELKLSPKMQNGLLKWVMNGAYFLIQVKYFASWDEFRGSIT